MKNQGITYALLLVFVISSLALQAQQNGDYRSKKSGSWKNKNTWQKFNNGSWGNTNQSPGNDATISVIIQSGHTISFDQNKSKVNNLVVEDGAKLYRNSSSNVNEIEIFGNITCNGIIGNGQTTDALSLAVNGISTSISGDGEIKLYNITKTSNTVSAASVIIETEITLTSTGVTINNTKNNTNLEVIINPGGRLTSNGTIDLKNGNPDKACSLTIKSDDTGYGSLITADIEDSDASNTLVERYLSEDKWHYIAAPVDNPTASVFYDIYFMEFDEIAGVWSYITNPNQTLTTDMKGYAAWTSSSILGNTTLEFQGELNVGSKNIDLTFTQNANHNHKGFNFVGNPYTSAVDWDYDGPNGWQKNNVDNAIYQWNGTMGVYGSYVNGFSVNEATNIVPAHQGFYVHCNQPTGSLGVDAGAQLHDEKEFFKSVNADDFTELRISVSGNGIIDETLILLNENGSTGFDKGLDALKMLGLAEVPQLYNMVGNDMLSINTLSGFSNLNFGFQCETEGIYTISWEGVDFVDSFGTIYLEDLVSGQQINMKDVNEYSFSHDGSTNGHRFNIKAGALSGINHQQTNFCNISASGNTIAITGLNTKHAEVSVYDLMGRNISEEKFAGNSFETAVDGKGYFVVKVVQEGEVQTQKVYIK